MRIRRAIGTAPLAGLGAVGARDRRARLVARARAGPARERSGAVGRSQRDQRAARRASRARRRGATKARGRCAPPRSRSRRRRASSPTSAAICETQQAARRDLTQETERANRRLAAEQDALARQVRSSYMTGREELFKLLLSQESPATLGRMLVYFDYYNRARSARIDAVAGELATARGARQADDARRSRACGARSGASARGRRSRASRDERRAAVAKLDDEIRDGNARSRSCAPRSSGSRSS